MNQVGTITAQPLGTTLPKTIFSAFAPRPKCNGIGGYILIDSLNTWSKYSSLPIASAKSSGLD